MQIATVQIKPQLECHCCTGNKEVEICPLENCNYPLCKNCKKKWLASNIDDRCPGCRRDIQIKIKPEKHIVYDDTTDSDSDSSSFDIVVEDYDDDDFNEIKCPCICICNLENNCEAVNSIMDKTLTLLLWFFIAIGIIVGLFFLTVIGRFVYILLFPYPSMGFWCERSPLPALFYLSTAILGLALSFCGICTLTCIFQCFKGDEFD